MDLSKEQREFMEKIRNLPREEAIDMSMDYIKKQAKEEPMGNAELTQVAMTSNLIFALVLKRIEALEATLELAAMTIELLVTEVNALRGKKFDVPNVKPDDRVH